MASRSCSTRASTPSSDGAALDPLSSTGDTAIGDAMSKLDAAFANVQQVAATPATGEPAGRGRPESRRAQAESHDFKSNLQDVDIETAMTQ